MLRSDNVRRAYPGLRPFEADEADLFFGREVHVDALLNRLSASHFVAVVGESGAGKSSLVRAGLLTALQAGFVVEAGSDWRTAVMRPGGTPLSALADALLAPGVLSRDGGTPHHGFALAELRRGPLGLVQLVRDAHLGESCNTLIVVDQFEELFRYCREPVQKDQASVFVELLLNASRQRQAPIFVVVTMRSDFIGDCARFSGLPETLNDNLYLTPRLSREQIAAAIREPARVCGGVIDSDLVDELCNAVGDNQDQLPLLQHLLMRLWDEARKQGKPAAGPDGRQPPWPRVTAELSRLLGGLNSALDNHAQQVYEVLPSDQRTIARILFKCMTDPLSPRRDVRRDTLVSEVAGVAGVPVDSVIAVANEFRAYGRHMLMPLPAVILEADSRLDISHESLLRQWSTLREWAREEGTNAREFVRLRDEAQRERSEEGELLSGRALARAQDWLKHAAPTPAWAERYAPPGELDATLAFIEKSEDQASRRKEEELLAAKREALARGARRRNWILGGGLVFATVFAAIIFTLWRLAASGLLEAEKQRQIADDQRDRADNQAKAAIDSANVATLLAEKLSLLAHDLKGEKDRVEAQNEELDRARVDAHTNLLTVSAARALPNDAALATLLARAAVAERPSDARALRMLRDSVAAHTPSIQSEVKVPRLRNYIPGKDKRLWLDFSLSSASLSPLHDSAITPSEADAVIWSTITGSRIQTLRGHEGVVGSAIFSPDGRFAVTTGSDNSARVWDVATGKELKKLTHGAMINGAVFNRNGTLLVTLGDDSRASLWTVGAYEDSRCELRVENSNFILASYSHDQHYLATVTHRNRTWQAQVWNIAADGCPQIEVEVLKQLDNIKWASFSESGAALGVVTEEGNVLVLSVPDWKEVSRFEPLTAYPRDSADSTEGTNSTEGLPPPPVAWSTDGRYFATAGGDNTVYISEIKPNPPRVPMRGHKGRVTSISFAPRDAALLTTSQDGTARLWALGPDKRPVESLVLTGHTEAVGSGAFSPGGNRVVTAGDDGNARVWTPLYALREWRRQDIRSAAYSADGRHIWVAGVERAQSRIPKVVGYWASELSVSTLSPSRDELKTTHALALHGTKIVESSLGVRDLREPSVLHPMPKTGPVSSNAFAGSSPTGRFAYATADKKTLIWDLSRPEASPEDARPTTGGNTIPAAASTVGCDLVAISDDKRLAWYCEDDKLVLVVHPGRTRPTQIPIPEGTKLQSGRFSTRGRLLALLMLEDHTVPVYDSSSSSEKPVSRLVGHSGRIRGIDFSLDDRFVVTASDDSTARVWEVSTGSQTAIVTPLEVSPLIGASFSPDGLSVALASSNRLLAWRCYACGDISVLSDEVRRRKIDRTLSPAEENDYRITSAELALQASSRPAHSNQGHVARR